MLDKTLDTIKKANPRELYDCIMSYCAATGSELPDNVRTRILLALRLAEEGLPNSSELSIVELQEIADFIERAQSLKDRHQRLVSFKDFIHSTIGNVEVGDLAFRGKELLMHFSPDLVLVSSYSPDVLDKRCSVFIEEFRAEYVNYHNLWYSKRLEIGDRFEQAGLKVEMLKRLNTLRKLGPAIGLDLIDEFEGFPSKISTCKPIKVADLGYSTECPFCGLQYKGGLDWAAFVKFEKRLDETCRKKLALISRKVAEVAVGSEEGPLRAFIDAVAVSDLDKLYLVLDDEVLEALRKVFALEG